MRLDVLIVFNIQLCLLCLVIAPFLPLIRKKLPHIPSPLYFIFPILLGFLLRGFWTDTYGTPLFYLPIPLPSISAVIPAFAMEDNVLLQKLWYLYGTGAGLTLLILTGSYILFRWRLQLDQSPCPQRVTDLAEHVFREKQYQLLMDICKRRNREPKEKELVKLQKQKVPRIIISDAVHTPGILPSLRSCFILDKADYTDEQLEAIFFYLFDRSGGEAALMHWYTLFFTSVCWFNPLFWFWHRTMHTDRSILTEGTLFATDEETAERHNPDFYKTRKAAHEKLLGELVLDKAPHRNFFPIASTKRDTERRKYSLRQNKLEFVSGFAFVFILIFEIFMPFIVQPYENPPLSEQSLFSVLGISTDQLHDDVGAIDQFHIISAEKDSLLYGTDSVWAESNSHGTVHYITLAYEPDTDPAQNKEGWHRLYDALCERLGESSRPFTAALYTDFIWNTTDINGESVRIRMTIRPMGMFNFSDGVAYVYIYLE